MSSSSGPTAASSSTTPAGDQTLVSTAPQPEEVGLPPRRNGWNWPWHPFQGIAWFFVFFFALSYFGFMVFYIPGLYIVIAIVVRKKNNNVCFLYVGEFFVAEFVVSVPKHCNNTLELCVLLLCDCVCL